MDTNRDIRAGHLIWLSNHAEIVTKNNNNKK